MARCITLVGSLFLLSLLSGQQPYVYDAGSVHEISIQLPAKDWFDIRTSHRKGDGGADAIAEDTYEYRKADVTIDGVKVGQVGLRKKGFFGSAISTRPSLKIKFDKYLKDQKFRGLAGLTLNNNNQDKAMVQTFISYEFFRKAGAPAPRANFAHVKVNGEDLGVYTNVESMEESVVPRLFGSSNGLLYEGYAGDFSKETFGRILEKGGDRDQNRNRLNELNAILQSPAKLSLDKIKQYVELDPFIKLWAAEVLIGHWDSYSGNRNNYYMYLDPKTMKITFLPWGPDSVFSDPGPFITQPVPKSVKAAGVLTRRLWELPEIRNLYRREMKRLIDQVWDEKALSVRIRELQKVLEPYSTGSKALFAASNESILGFIQNRRSQIQKELDAPAPDWPQLPETATLASTGSVITGTFTAPFLTTPAQNPLVSGKATLKVDGAGAAPNFKAVGASVAMGTGELSFIREGYPVLSIVAQDESTKEVWVISSMLDPYLINSNPKRLPIDHYEIWSIVIRGKPSPAAPNADRRVFGNTGEMHFDQISLTPGGQLTGSFRLQTGPF